CVTRIVRCVSLDCAFRRRRDWAEVALVEPGIRLLGEDAGDPFAVQIDPLVAGAVEAAREGLQAAGVDLADRLLDLCFGVSELQRGQRLLAITIAGGLALVAG